MELSGKSPTYGLGGLGHPWAMPRHKEVHGIAFMQAESLGAFSTANFWGPFYGVAMHTQRDGHFGYKTMRNQDQQGVSSFEPYPNFKFNISCMSSNRNINICTS